MSVIDKITNPKQLQNILDATSDLPNTRLASGVSNRDKQVMTWMLANGSTVQMYINPENFVISESKQITQTRTKGGFIVQYWGDNLTKLSLSGTTGSSGVKGINVLRDIYRSENRIFELIAANNTSDIMSNIQNADFTGANAAESVAAMAKTMRDKNFILRPSLASLAVGVVLFYQGVEYRGFFTSMNITEDVSKLGMFSYQIEFMATETRGSRENFMAWHREPLADDPAGQALNAIASFGANAMRGLMGLNQQQSVPLSFHPGSAPLSYSNPGSSIAAMAGVDYLGNNL